jgi:hypothetical protein
MDAEGWQVASASGRRSGKAKRGVDGSGEKCRAAMINRRSSALVIALTLS